MSPPTPAAMAFVPTTGALSLRATSFLPSTATRPTAPPRAARTRMLVDDGEVVPSKGSKWKETLFGFDVAGGIPGGEDFLQKWITEEQKGADGGGGEFSDMPDKLQPGKPLAAKLRPKIAPSFLDRVDAIEFIKKFPGQGDAPAPEDGEEEEADAPPTAAAVASKAVEAAAACAGAAVAAAQAAADMAVSAPGTQRAKDAAAAAQSAMMRAAEAASAAADPEAPDASLYEAYYPAATRNLAPEFSFVHEKGMEESRRRVGMAMTPVTAKCTDVWFPKEREGKAPKICISYNGSDVSNASVSMTCETVEPLPATALVPRGQASAELRPTQSGGLKLVYSVDGESIKL